MPIGRLQPGPKELRRAIVAEVSLDNSPVLFCSDGFSRIATTTAWAGNNIPKQNLRSSRVRWAVLREWVCEVGANQALKKLRALEAQGGKIQALSQHDDATLMLLR